MVYLPFLDLTLRRKNSIDTSFHPPPACRVPDAVLNDAAPWLKQRFALRLLADALEGGRVPSAALQLVSILAVPELGWEGDVAALIVAVKLQASVLSGYCLGTSSVMVPCA